MKPLVKRIKQILFLTGILLIGLQVFAQKTPEPARPQRPKLVVGLMVDQMRWDFFYRYYDRYGADGFKRLLNTGFRCENTNIPYAQTVTAAGHSCVYTGSVPAISGIMGNEWYSRSLGRGVYCVEDSSVQMLDASPTMEPMSPRNLWVSTITDELRLATNFKGKTVGVAIKDRGSILPAGHTGDAYWYDAVSGRFVTSTYYKKQTPAWVKAFNDLRWPAKLYEQNWNTLYPIETYSQSTADNKIYEGKFLHEEAPVFPHELKSQIDRNYGLLSVTPYGNTITLEFAKEALQQEKLGNDEHTDFLAISLSSPDYIGHQFGPNSIEIEDTYLRLDLELAAFFKFLDKQLGKDNYLFFITADHGVAHVPGFLAENKFPVSTMRPSIAKATTALRKEFGLNNTIKSADNYHLYLDHDSIEKAGKDLGEVVDFLVKLLNKEDDVWMAFPADDISEANMPSEVKETFLKGYNTKLGGDLIFIPKAGMFYSSRNTGTTHGAWYPYDSHIPLVFMGKGIKPGVSYAQHYMTDIAATLAALLQIQAPSGCIGKPIEAVLK